MDINEIKRIKEARDRIFNELHREPFIEELCVELNLELDKKREEIEFALSYENEEYNPEPSLKMKMTIKNNEMEKARSALGFKQTELAEKVGIGMATLCQIECCRIYPPKEIQEKISKVLGISIRVLFPEWLKAFSEKWKRQEKTKIIPIKEIRLGESHEMLMIESGDFEDMVKKTEMDIAGKRIHETIDLYLSKKEKEIIELKFGFTDDGPLTYEEVGQRFGVTRERIRQIEARVLEKLRSKINKELFTFND